MHESNPKAYWEIVNAITGGKKHQELPDVPRFIDHFNTLNNRTVEITPERQHIIDKLHEMENVKIFNELDFRISEAEIIKAIKSLKNGKSTGIDQISIKNA
jgi:hypothetical protein